MVTRIAGSFKSSCLVVVEDETSLAHQHQNVTIFKMFNWMNTSITNIKSIHLVLYGPRVLDLVFLHHPDDKFIVVCKNNTGSPSKQTNPNLHLDIPQVEERRL